MNYYEELGVAEQASKTEIKKAYFAMVKQYPPERFPEEFKRFRKAYEVLIDPNARTQYDNLASIPNVYRELYDSALRAMEYENYEKAIQLLKEVVKENPELQILNSLLGEIYLKNDNSGNAVKIFEKLVLLEPANSSYHGKLAEAYTLRGYTKKAITQFEKSLAMEPDNVLFCAGLAKAYANINSFDKAIEILEKGLIKARENGFEDLELHLQFLFVGIQAQSFERMQQHRDVLLEKAANDSAVSEYILKQFLETMFTRRPDENQLKQYHEAICFLSELDPKSDIVALIKKELDTLYTLKKLDQDDNIPDYIMMMTEHMLRNCDCVSCKIDILMIQIDFLYNINAARRALSYLRKTYPDIYTLNKVFYDKIMDPKKERRLMESTYKAMRKYENQYPDEFSAATGELDYLDDDTDDMDAIPPFYPESEPYIRDQPKTGRNDPCPCGSGKKYKKCCGANA